MKETTFLLNTVGSRETYGFGFHEIGMFESRLEFRYQSDTALVLFLLSETVVPLLLDLVFFFVYGLYFFLVKLSGTFKYTSMVLLSCISFNFSSTGPIFVETSSGFNETLPQL